MASIVPLRRVRLAEPSSEALVAAMAKGDPAALGSLFDRYHRDVYRFLAAAVAAIDLDDLVQDTFLAAFKSASRFQQRSSVKTWLFGIGLNLARNHARRARRRTAEPLIAGLRVARDAPVEAREQLARMADAISNLPTELRAAYVACVIEDLSGEEAAELLGVAKGTIWRRVHEARELLRLHIGRDSQ
jgi:RNA polymerase sigma-70 factor (ECF subfamily)